MKKILLPVFMIFAGLVYCQDEDLMKMYERITGKDLSKEIEKLKSETDSELKDSEEAVIDTISYTGKSIEEKGKKDSIPDLTYFEKYVGGKVIDPYESELKQYSIDFSSVRTNLNYNRHIPDNYMLNPGDLFIIDIWGAIEKSYNIELTNENFIIIPQIGKVDLSGSSYGSAKEIIANRLSKISGIDYSIRLGEVRPITVFVVGNVSNPGVYNVSPFSSIIEVLALAGGVNKQGSLRSIDLISEKSKSREVDLYSLLFFGKNTVSILESNMTIFVPLIGKQVAVAGNVKREGIYEALEKEKLEDIIKIAGITPFSDTSRIEIERLDKKGRTKIMSFSLKKNPDIQAGDIIRIFSTLVYNRDFVYLKGNFRHNKMVQFDQGMRLGDVLWGSEVLKDNTDMSYASIIRKNGLGQRDVIINFSPSNVIDKKQDHNISLASRDTIEVFSLDSVNHFASVEISGEIKNPGVYKHTKEMTVSNLISYSGGITANGDLSNVIIIRNSGKDGYEYFSDIDAKSFKLKSDDKVHVFDYAANNPVQKVQVWGYIKKNGSYIHSKNMTVTDLITLSGGFQSEAMTDSIEVVSGINQVNDSLKTAWYEYSEIDTVILNPNDIVFVRRIKDFGRVNYVKIYGEVEFPGMYALRENEELSDLLLRCGGFTKNAQIRSTQIFREEVKIKQESKIKELKKELNNKLQLQMLISGDQDLAGALNIAKFDSVEASGRVILDIDEDGNHEDFYFQDKDSIYVPPVSKTILVMGEVYQQTAINYNPDQKRLKYYLDKVGGVTDTADRDNIYVIKSNGELVKEKGWFDNIMSYSMEPGDMIYVPYDYTKIDFFELTKDVTTILYQLSLSAATVHQVTR